MMSQSEKKRMQRPQALNSAAVELPPLIPGHIQQRMEVDIASDATDPQGSWTGVPEDPWETPVQDADDL